MKTKTDKQKAELKALSEMPDESIDTSDIPVSDRWEFAEVGKFYKPVKKQVSIRLKDHYFPFSPSEDGQTTYKKVTFY